MWRSRVWLERGATAARWLCGTALLASAIRAVLVGFHAPGVIAVGPVDVPVASLKIGFELVVASLLILPWPSRATGLSLLLIAAGLLVLRTAAAGGTCSCLDALGGYKPLVWTVWAALTAVGVYVVVQGSWSVAWRNVFEVTFGACALLTCVHMAAVPSVDSQVLDGRIIIKARRPTEEAGELRISNQSYEVVRDLVLVPTCDCIRLGAAPETIPSQATIMVPILIQEHPTSVRPGVEIKGASGEEDVRRVVWLAE